MNRRYYVCPHFSPSDLRIGKDILGVQDSVSKCGIEGYEYPPGKFTVNQTFGPFSLDGLKEIGRNYAKQ